MYGLINIVIEQLVTRKFGVATWESIRSEAGNHIPNPFSMHERYADEITYDLVAAAEKVLGVPAAAILELFGRFFFEFCVEIGYDRLLRALGGTPIDFLEQLDGLHDHLSTTFVGYHAPSFRVTRDENGDGTEFYLHYYSARPGLGPVVVGVLKASLKELYSVDVEVRVATDQGEEQEPGEVCFLITLNSKQKEGSRRESEVPRPVAFTKGLISPQSFSQLFPFHVTFNRDLEITSCGNVVRRFFQPTGDLLNLGLTIDSMFEIIRPRLPGFSFMNILALINTTYVLRQREATTTSTKPLKLRGRMMYQWQANAVIFLCSPSATDLQDLFEQGVYLTDIPLHDAVKDLILMSEAFAKEQEAARQMEVMTHIMQSRLDELEAEKKKTDRLIYSVVPPAIADDLRCKRTIPSLRYDDVTVMFSSVDGFAAFSSTHHPIQIVTFLNRLYTIFDAILDPHVHPKVYKVETIADYYIVVSGCPAIVEDHALAIANLAVDLVDRCERVDDVSDATRALKITIGIHSGEIVAGIIGNRMPRYCLFGDTINLTSRTATYGKKGFINVTQETYNRVHGSSQAFTGLDFKFHDNVIMKGKVEPVPVWLLSRRTTHAHEGLHVPGVQLQLNGHHVQMEPLSLGSGEQYENHDIPDYPLENQRSMSTTDLYRTLTHKQPNALYHIKSLNDKSNLGPCFEGFQKNRSKLCTIL